MSQIILKTLIDAVEVSPENGPLRYRLAETLRQHQRWADAANEYLIALRLEGVSVEKARFGLAQTLLYLDKAVAGIELVESLLDLKLTIPLPPIHLLHARLLLLNGDTSRAVGEYIRAIEGDATLADHELATALGLKCASNEAKEPPNSAAETVSDATSEHEAVQTEKDTDTAQLNEEVWTTPIAKTDVGDIVEALSLWLTSEDFAGNDDVDASHRY